MPVGNDLTLSNKYGNTDIDELHGLIDLDIKYGNITAGKLTRGNIKPLSNLNLAYGKGTIDETGWLDLTERYVGSMEIAKSQAILLDSKYSKITLDETSSIVGQCKYDNIRIGNIKNLVLENGYTEVNIGELTKKLTFNGSYGSFSIAFRKALNHLMLKRTIWELNLGLKNPQVINSMQKFRMGD